MPIRPENKDRYPKNWKAISKAIIVDRAKNRCEKCGAENHKPHPITGSKVVLTTAHLDHTPENCDQNNLRAWCQKCHNSYDAKHRAAGIKERHHILEYLLKESEGNPEKLKALAEKLISQPENKITVDRTNLITRENYKECVICKSTLPQERKGITCSQICAGKLAHKRHPDSWL